VVSGERGGGTFSASLTSATGAPGSRELAAMKKANATLRTELTTNLLRLQQLGGSDPKAAELISNAFRSLESLQEDIAWPTVRIIETHPRPPSAVSPSSRRGW